MELKDITVDALQCSKDDCTESNGKLVLHKEILKKHTDKLQFHMVAQFNKLVKSSVLNPEFVFSGLNRDLFNDDNNKNDNDKLIYISNPRFDYIWEGGKFNDNSSIKKIKKPENCIFTVIVSINVRHKKDYPDVFGFIEEWSWCDSESNGRRPVNWIDRYGGLIYKKLSLIK